jgi:hypothetical protein
LNDGIQRPYLVWAAKVNLFLFKNDKMADDVVIYFGEYQDKGCGPMQNNHLKSVSQNVLILPPQNGTSTKEQRFVLF